MEQQRKNYSQIYKNASKCTSSAGYKNYENLIRTLPSRFYTEKEEVTLRFYQTPKALFKNPEYKGLSLGAKLMYSVLRDRLDISVKNGWKDEHGYIYLKFSGEDLLNLLEISKNTVTKYKRELIKYNLIIDKRLGQGKSNIIYVLKPEIKEYQNPKKSEFRIPKNGNLESQKIRPNDTIVNNTNINNTVNGNGPVENLNDTSENITKAQGDDYENLAGYLAYELEDRNSIGFYRKVAENIPYHDIMKMLGIVKDNTGKVNNKGAYFTSLVKKYAPENNINIFNS
jgi:hypothetical protein